MTQVTGDNQRGSDDKYIGNTRILAATKHFTLMGKPRRYPANILLNCQAPGCGNAFWAHLPSARWCSNACRSRSGRQARKDRDHARWAENRRKRELEAQQPQIAQKAAQRLPGALGAKRIVVNKPESGKRPPDARALADLNRRNEQSGKMRRKGIGQG